MSEPRLDDRQHRDDGVEPLGAHHVLMGAVVLAMLAVPFLLGGAEPDDTAPAGPGAAASDDGAAIDAGVHAPLPRGETREIPTPVEPAVFDCKPVAHDDSIDEDIQYPVPLPPFSPEVFPCTRCHDKPDDFNTTKRNLTLEHVGIKLVHGPREQWCYGCHNPTDRDRLRLAGGRTVSFTESYELCGQCHGPKLRDWRLGIHGRRTGCWNGESQYLLCVHCHSPHAPAFPQLEPKPRPRKPTEL